MTSLPPGWRVRALGEVAETQLGKMLDKGRVTGAAKVPYLRNANVQWGHIDTSDVLQMEMPDEQRERFLLREADLVVCEGGEIGRCAIWTGGDGWMAYQKALHRIRSGPNVDVRYLRHLLDHYSRNGTLKHHATGSTIAHLPQEGLRQLPIPLAPLDEQRRIVDLLEDHLSRLDAAHEYLRASRRRLDNVRRAAVWGALTGSDVAGSRTVSLARADTDDGDLPALPADWDWKRLGDLADVVGGVTKDAKKQSAPDAVQVPYLRVANVQRGSLDLREVTTIRVPAAKAEALRLLPGDVLLNEGGDRDKLGRGWVWEGQIDRCIHQNHVFRARVRDGAIDPYLLSWAGNYIGGAWCERNGRQSVNLASISLSKIRLMPVPVPPQHLQPAIRTRIDGLSESTRRLASAISASEQRSAGLRRALLEAAFSGRLTGRSVDGEIVEELADAGV